jgi:feruloyl esterase
MKPSAVLLLAGLGFSAATGSRISKRQGTSCTSLVAPDMDDAIITSIQANESSGICEVYVYLTHTGASDNVSVITFLPIDNWNGRYQGTGGAGFSTGGSSTELNTPAQAGYVVGTTDGGLRDDSNSANFANDPQLTENFAYLSIHDMTVVGKALAEQFYGTPVKYPYWNGCSTGRRQGYMEAQRYPEDYNGIYAASPPLDYTHFQVSRLGPYVVRNVEGEFVAECIYDTLTNDAIAECDTDDGGADSLISDPNTCQFDATTLIGQAATACDDNGTTVITSLQTSISNKIAYGPVDLTEQWLYFGIAKGASYGSLAGTTPYPDVAGFTQARVLNGTGYDLAQLDYASFPALFAQAYAERDALISTSDADLGSFRDAGGRLLSWHGWADASIYANETADC